MDSQLSNNSFHTGLQTQLISIAKEQNNHPMSDGYDKNLIKTQE